MEYIINIPHWTPTTTNKLIHSPWIKVGKKRIQPYAIKMKLNDSLIIQSNSRNLPIAKNKRRISLDVYGWPTGRLPDPDAFWKSTLDALKRIGLLVDDSQKWCEQGQVAIHRAKTKFTEIRIEEIENAR